MEKPADKSFVEQYYYDKTETYINSQYCHLRTCLATGKPEEKGGQIARAYKLYSESHCFDYNPDFEKDEFYPGDFCKIRICYNDRELKKIKKQNNDFALLPPGQLLPEQPEKNEEEIKIIVKKKKNKKKKNKQIIEKTPEEVLVPEQLDVQKEEVLAPEQLDVEQEEYMSDDEDEDGVIDLQRSSEKRKNKIYKPPEKLLGEENKILCEYNEKYIEGKDYEIYLKLKEFGENEFLKFDSWPRDIEDLVNNPVAYDLNVWRTSSYQALKKYDI